jgi:hypothetical protein
MRYHDPSEDDRSLQHQYDILGVLASRASQANNVKRNTAAEGIPYWYPQLGSF